MQSANLSGPLKGLRPYQALLGPTQASGLAGGFDCRGFRSIHLSSSQNFCNITAVWARVARPWGERAPSPVPLMTPAFTAQSRASSAQPEIRS